MCPQVPDFDPQMDVHQGTVGEVSPGAVARPGEAVAAAGAQGNETEQAFLAHYMEARRAANLSNHMADASARLGDASLKWGRVPDRVQAEQGFDQDSAAIKKDIDSKIDDPLLQAHFDASFAAESAGRRIETAHDAFGLEADKRKGELDQNLFTFAQQAASAKDPMLRAKIIDEGNKAIEGAASAGWINGDEKFERARGFTSNIQRVQAEQLIDGAVQSQDPRDAMKASAAIADPENFPGMDPQVRESLQFRIDRLQDRYENRAVAQQAHNDAVADRDFHKMQAHNEAVLLAGENAGTNPLSDIDIQKMADSGQISAGGVEALHSARDKTLAGVDVPAPTLQLWHALDTGHGNANDVYAASNAHQISKDTAVQMLRMLDAGATPAARNARTILNLAVRGSASGSGVWKTPGEADTRLAAARGSFEARLANGEDPDAALSDVIPLYAQGVASPTWLAPPRLGQVKSFADLQKVAGATVKAHDAHQIDDAAYQGQVELLNNYQRFFLAKQEADAANGRKPAPKPQQGGR